MDSLSGADALFSALSQQQTQRQTLATYALASGASFLQKKNYTDAITQFKKAVAMDPNSQDAYTYLGNTYLQVNKTKEAADAFKNLVRLNPTSVDAHNSLGNAYLQANNYAEA